MMVKDPKWRLPARSLGLLLILWLAFFLRVWALAGVPIDNDESYDYNRWVSVSFQAIVLDDLILNNQSLSHVLTRLALLVGGDNLFALRWPAVCISLLGVALLYRFSGRLLGRRVGLWSMLLLAVSPYAVFFAHTYRGYSGVVVLPLLIYLLAWAALRTNRWSYWLALGLACPLAMYAHLFTVFAVLNLTLFIGLVWLVGGWPGYLQQPRPGRWLASLALTGLVLLVLYAPIWVKILGNLITTGQLDLADFLWVQRPQVPGSFWTSQLWFNGLEKGSFGLYGSLAFLGLVLAGIEAGLAAGRRGPIFALVAWAILPFLEIWLLGRFLPVFWARPSYLGFTLPPMLVLAGLALAALPAAWSNRKWLLGGALAGLALLLALFWFLTLRQFYTVYPNGNWLPVGNKLHQKAAPADLVVCQRYDQPWRNVDIDGEDNCTRVLNYRRKADTPMAADVQIAHSVVYGTLPQAGFGGLVNRRGRVWLVVWNVPASLKIPPAEGVEVVEFDGFGRSLLFLAGDQETYVANLAAALDSLRPDAGEGVFIYNLMVAPLAAATGQEELARSALEVAAAHRPDHPDSRARLAETEQLVQTLAPLSIRQPLAVNFDGEIMLHGYNLETPAVAPGSSLRFTLFWEGLQPMAKNYTVFLHLRDHTGRTVAQFDYQPFGGAYPTQNWQVGQLLAEPHEFQVPADFPAGAYELVIGFYDRESLARLPLVDDQSGENAFYLTPVIVR